MHFEIANHLGNVLAVVGDRKIVVTSSSNDWLFDHYLADLWSVSDYHPFGMAVEERSWAAEEYRFGFNGKENDAEWDAQDYGGRIYIPKQARWISPDPLAEKFTSLSAYSYVANMPINAVDPDGRDIVILFARGNVEGLGHSAVLIGSDKDGWYLYSKNGTDGKWGSRMKGPHRGLLHDHGPNTGNRYVTLADFIKSKEVRYHYEDRDGYTDGIYIKTSASIDKMMKQKALSEVLSDYSLLFSNCVDVCSRTLKAGGFEDGNTPNLVPNNPVPNFRQGGIWSDNMYRAFEVNLSYLKTLSPNQISEHISDALLIARISKSSIFPDMNGVMSETPSLDLKDVLTKINTGLRDRGSSPSDRPIPRSGNEIFEFPRIYTGD